ncbi:multidrug MFS transporter [Candidatus Beckwithbacteria bacterium CG10_big_fil_rev_8_21_14_0_10_34_10]|uniref:Multidrug MFS transporter n=1 Tax=Candidatus Beckwithbacteria bacterium CG10_big_fil_rev_8_21_14_0_10_34_10 TaxID=1974495 RepID=A0A2H0WCC8_9BACT|nr:MAG: multidrug MFS transporter [Candidatus Beckwithbacteria bacterium CG10_big_fil_rev_8_21_14_0_10_34_10]
MNNTLNNFYLNKGKRIFDLIFSLFVIILTFPLFVIIGILIGLQDPRGIFFAQKRAGKNGKEFCLYKFRTMKKGAEELKNKYISLNEADGPVFKIKNDPRFINSFSKFLAHSGLDELPNIFNVLKGDLSWVGPRPLPLDEEKKIKAKIRIKRSSIKPGICSSWIYLGAHNLSFKKWMKLDLEYLKKAYFKKDLEIISKTFKMIVLFLQSKIL